MFGFPFGLWVGVQGFRSRLLSLEFGAWFEDSSFAVRYEILGKGGWV